MNAAFLYTLNAFLLNIAKIYINTTKLHYFVIVNKPLIRTKLKHERSTKPSGVNFAYILPDFIFTTNHLIK